MNVLSRRVRRAINGTQWSHSRTSTPIISAPRKTSLKKRRWPRFVPTPGANPQGGARSRPRSARPRRKYSETHPQRKKKKIKKKWCGSVEDPRSVPSVVPLRRQRSHTTPPAPHLGARGASARVSTRPPNSLRRAPAVGFAHGRGARAGGNLCRASDAPQRARAATVGEAGAQARKCTRTWHARTCTGACTRAVRPHTEAHTHTHTHACTRTQSHTHSHTHTRSSGGRCARRTHSARARRSPLLRCRAALPLRRAAPFFFSCLSRAEAEPEPNRTRAAAELWPAGECPPAPAAPRSPGWDPFSGLARRARARPRSDPRPPILTPPQPRAFSPRTGTWLPGTIALLQKNNDSVRFDIQIGSHPNVAHIRL